MKNGMKWLVSAGMASLLLGCEEQAGTVEEPPPKNAEETSAPENKEESKVIYLDVRTAEEYNEGFIEGAVNIPHTEVAERIGEVTEDKSAEIAIYCARGGRAAMALEALEELGYTNLRNEGGYEELKEKLDAE
ncbi:MAG: rhodanese-like domain-containing protein [Verrucomicrobiota bacterium]